MNKIQIGDIFYNSWGYEQTQVDFYEVIRISPSGKSVDLRPIGFQWTEPDNWDCATVIPDPEGTSRFTHHDVQILKNKRLNFRPRHISVPVTEPGERIADHKIASLWNGSPCYFTPRSQPGY